MENICRRMRSLANLLEGIDFEAYDAEQDRRGAAGPVERIRRRPRGRRDPNMPKMPSNSYAIYTRWCSEHLREENVQLPLHNFLVTVAGRWRALSAEEKQPYVDLANEDKGRYEREMQEYRRNNP
ncbi:high mobility group box domain-containing protein [Phycomyces blakesleeanus]